MSDNRGFGGLQGQRRAENPTVKQGKQRGLSLPGLGQPGVLLKMDFAGTQEREQCSRVLAFSISMFTRALYSISVSSTMVPGAGGKCQGRMPVAVPRPRACPPLGTHPPVSPASAGSENAHGAWPCFAAKTFLITAGLLAPWGSWLCSPHPPCHVRLGTGAAVCPQPCPCWAGTPSSPLSRAS